MRRTIVPEKPVRPRKPKDIPSDVNGSYTGVPEIGRQPVQDADDL